MVSLFSRQSTLAPPRLGTARPGSALGLGTTTTPKGDKRGEDWGQGQGRETDKDTHHAASFSVRIREPTRLAISADASGTVVMKSAGAKSLQARPW